jgi:hypothetical protein
MTSKETYTALNAFMGKMRDGNAHDLVANMQAALDYQAEKLRIYEEKYQEATGKARPEMTDDDRRRLARKARAMNSHLLAPTEQTWTPNTVMGWYRELIAEKYDSTGPGQKKRGRQVVSQEIIDLIVKIGGNNPNWGYRRITDYLAYLETVRKAFVERFIRRWRRWRRFPRRALEIGVHQRNPRIKRRGLLPIITSWASASRP